MRRAIALSLMLLLPAASQARSRVREVPMSEAPSLSSSLSFETVDGGSLALEDLVGKKVLLITWASW
jgi:hypothetical protein